MRGTKETIKRRRGADHQGSPIPIGGQETGIVNVKSTCKVTDGQWATSFPQVNPARVVGGKLPDRIPRKRRDMGRFGSAWAKACFRALGDVPILASGAG